MHHTTRAVLALALLSGTAAADSAVTKKTTARDAAPPTFELSAGGYRDARSLLIEAENPEGITQYQGVPTMGVAVDAAFYPLHVDHAKGIRSSFGVSLGYSRSIGGDLTFVDGAQTTKFGISQSAWNAAAHHRLTAGRVMLDSQLGIGQTRYGFENMPLEIEVPDTALTYAAAGAQLGVDVYRGITIGAGAKYMTALGGGGELTSVDWYGPGRSSGVGLEASLTVPLPAGMFVRAKLAAQTIKTEFDGIGEITEMEGVTESNDTTSSATFSIGVRR